MMIPINTYTNPRIEVEFSLPNATNLGGRLLFLEAIDKLGLGALFNKHVGLSKAPWADYQSDLMFKIFIADNLLGIERLFHHEAIEQDPLLSQFFGLEKLPDYTLLYEDLRRYSLDDIRGLKRINLDVMSEFLDPDGYVILDFDTTVNQVFGAQEGSDIGYNPRYMGRPSYQPFLAFDGISGAWINCELKSGSASTCSSFPDFYKQTKAYLPNGVPVKYVRADSGFAGPATFLCLEEDKVGYTIKMKSNNRLIELAQQPRLWTRVQSDNTVIEVASFKYQASTWSKKRRVVVVRSCDADLKQLRLPGMQWEYQFIVTNLDWDPEDIWHFYNKRCGCENYIKDGKHGFAIDKAPTAEFTPNYADLVHKMIAYNVYRWVKATAATAGSVAEVSVQRFRRMLVNIPGKLVSHGRRIMLKLSDRFRYQRLWQLIRQRIVARPTSLAPTG